MAGLGIAGRVTKGCMAFPSPVATCGSPCSETLRCCSAAWAADVLVEPAVLEWGSVFAIRLKPGGGGRIGGRPGPETAGKGDTRPSPGGAPGARLLDGAPGPCMGARVAGPAAGSAVLWVWDDV